MRTFRIKAGIFLAQALPLTPTGGPPLPTKLAINWPGNMTQGVIARIPGLVSFSRGMFNVEQKICKTVRG